jgi:hypothetical protein
MVAVVSEAACFAFSAASWAMLDALETAVLDAPEMTSLAFSTVLPDWLPEDCWLPGDCWLPAEEGVLVCGRV